MKGDAKKCARCRRWFEPGENRVEMDWGPANGKQICVSCADRILFQNGEWRSEGR